MKATRNLFFLVAKDKAGRRRFGFHLQLAGRWFASFTFIVTLFTMMSENNILYFLSSICLSSLILNALFTDFALYKIQVHQKIGEAFANEVVADVWELYNPSFLPLLGIQMGVFANGEYTPHASIEYLGPFSRKKILVKNKHSYERGIFSWESLYVMSEAPLGWTAKYIHQGAASSRLIWPEPKKSLKNGFEQNDKDFVETRSSEKGEHSSDEVEGLRNYEWNDEFRLLDAKRSDFLTWDLKTKRFHSSRSGKLMSLDLRSVGSESEFEVQLSRISHELKRSHETLVTLEVKFSYANIKRIQGREKILNYCASLEWRSLLPKTEVELSQLQKAV